MKTFILPVALLMSFILSGCITSRMAWRNSGIDPVKFDQDSARCKYNSSRSWESDSIQARKLFIRCMESSGYYR
jgi:hypothetical protein